MKPSLIQRLYFSLAKRALILYSMFKKVDTETYSKVSELKVRGRLAKLHSGGEEAIYTGRFIDVLKITNLEDLGISCNDFSECSTKVLIFHNELAKKLKEDFLSVYHSFPNVSKDYLRTLAHEYLHWSMLSGTRTAVILEKIAWKERIDTMYFTYLFNTHVNLGKLVGPQFAREDKADIIGDRLSEAEAKSKIKEISQKIDDFIKNDNKGKALKAFLDVVNDLNALTLIGNLIALVVEPATWGIVEDQNYFSSYVDAYFGDSEIKKEFAKKIYNFALTHRPEEVISRVRSVLNAIDVLSLMPLVDQNDKKVVEELDRIFFSNNLSDTSWLSLSLKDLVPELVRDYLKDKLSNEKIDMLTKGIFGNKEVLKYVTRTLSKLKAEMSGDNLPSICYNIAWRDSLIAGCYNPDVGITGKCPVYRPFGSFEEIVGNLALSLKLSLLLAAYYAQDLEKRRYKKNRKDADSEYCQIVAKLSERAKFAGVDDFYKIACDEVEEVLKELGLQLDKILYYPGYVNAGNTNSASKALKAFLVYWTYLVLRTGNKSPSVLGSRHGIYML